MSGFNSKGVWVAGGLILAFSGLLMAQPPVPGVADTSPHAAAPVPQTVLGDLATFQAPHEQAPVAIGIGYPAIPPSMEAFMEPVPQGKEMQMPSLMVIIAF